MHRFNFKSAIFASIIATIAMTIWMFLLGIDIMGVLGMTAGMSGGLRYLVGGGIHLIIGIFWGIVYAALFEPLMKNLPRFLSGALFSLVPFFCAFLFMGFFLTTVQTVFRANQPSVEVDIEICTPSCCQAATPQCDSCYVNPQAMPKAQTIAYSCPPCVPCTMCDPCAVCAPCALCGTCAPCQMSPCSQTNPCAMKKQVAPCAPTNPCAMKKQVAPCAPTNPCSMKKQVAPCALKKQTNTMNQTTTQSRNMAPCGVSCMPASCGMGCAPCSPQTGKGVPMWVWALLNHLVYGIVLGLVYRPCLVHKSE